MPDEDITTLNEEVEDTSSESSTEETTPTHEADTAPDAGVTGDEQDEPEAGADQLPKTVPYERFKEVNDSKKTLEALLSNPAVQQALNPSPATQQPRTPTLEDVTLQILSERLPGYTPEDLNAPEYAALEEAAANRMRTDAILAQTQAQTGAAAEKQYEATLAEVAKQNGVTLTDEDKAEIGTLARTLAVGMYAQNQQPDPVAIAELAFSAKSAQLIAKQAAKAAREGVITETKRGITAGRPSGQARPGVPNVTSTGRKAVEELYDQIMPG